jgi:hypothetical protein
MARQPFYGRGPGPAIARMDMNAATAPGRAYGQMFANLGKIAGDSIEKYAEGKKKKEEQKQTASFIKRALINSPEIAAQFGIQGDDSMTFEEAVDQGSNAIAKDPKGFEMVKGFTAMAAQQRKAQQETELFNRKISQFDQSQDTADELKEKTAGFEEFLSEQPQVIDPTGPGRFDVLRNLREGKGVTPPARMIPGASPAEEMLMSPEAKSFARRAVEGGQPMSLVMPMAQKIDSQIAAQTPKPPTRSEILAREQFEYKKAIDAEKSKPMPPVDSKYEEATLTAVDDALGFLTDDTKKFFSTGVIGQALSNVAGTDATSLRSKLDTITSGVGFGRLNDMREASKTGGALGNVSEIELRQLNASMGSLNPNQKPSELKKTLETIKEHYESTVRVLKAEKYAYDNGLTFKTPKEAMDFVERYNNLNASSPQQTTNTIDPSAPASQATLDVLEKKRQLRSKRAGL